MRKQNIIKKLQTVLSLKAVTLQSNMTVDPVSASIMVSSEVISPSKDGGRNLKQYTSI